MSDVKTIAGYSTMAATAVTATYVAYCMYTSSSEISSTVSKEQTMKVFFDELKKDLQQYKIEIPKDENGFIEKDFFVTLHMIIYKYKKYGQEMLMDVNFKERIVYLEQMEELKDNQEDQTEEGKKQSEECKAMYDKLSQQENGELDLFTMKLQEYVFDYFNLIVKQYYVSLENWKEDIGYIRLIKEEYEKIDKQVEEEEQQEEVPEGLTKEFAR